MRNKPFGRMGKMGMGRMGAEAYSDTFTQVGDGSLDYASTEMDPSFPLLRRKINLQQTVEQLERNVSARERSADETEMRVSQGLKSNNTPQDLQSNLNKFLPPWLVPGNVGDINKVIWPFYFTFNAPLLAANSQGTATFTITQEAGFVWMSTTKAIFVKDPQTNAVTYVDPEQPGQSGKAPGLTWALSDAQSTRSFNQVPASMDNMGVPRFPTTLPTPLFFLPNSTVRMSYFNSSSTTYIPFVTFFGYRVRIEDAQNVLSTVNGGFGRRGGGR